VAALAAAVIAVGVPKPDTWAASLADVGPWALPWALACTVVLTAALVPRAVLAAAAGLLFGPSVGAAVVLAGVGVGAVAAFAAGRWLGRDLVTAHRRAAAVDAWVVQRGLIGVIVARLLPVAPFGLVSYLYGLSGMRLSVFWLGTMAGAAPSTVVYANLGAAALAPGSPGFAIALTMLEIDITPVLAAIGATGLVVGLALQGTLSNFASGLMILINRPFDVGNVVSAGGVTGMVHQMNLFSTTFRTFDNQTIHVPNNEIWNHVITNITANPTRRGMLEKVKT
jgi:uncharacterized membrane protein YdjX (TVP38/TMEM64 family)